MCKNAGNRNSECFIARLIFYLHKSFYHNAKDQAFSFNVAVFTELNEKIRYEMNENFRPYIFTTGQLQARK